jgi:hypothetical protein
MTYTDPGTKFLPAFVRTYNAGLSFALFCFAQQPCCFQAASLITGRRPAELQALETAVVRHAYFYGRKPAVYCKLFPQLTRHCDFDPCIQIDT